jgi:hypothetical protein
LMGMSFLSFFLSPILVAILAICRGWTWKSISLWGAKIKRKIWSHLSCCVLHGFLALSKWVICLFLN